MKISDVCNPEKTPLDIKVATGINDAITKVNWINNNNTVLVGKRSGVLELWDIRENNNNEKPSNSITLSDKAVVIDMEVSLDKNILLVAAGKHVTILNLFQFLFL